MAKWGEQLRGLGEGQVLSGSQLWNSFPRKLPERFIPPTGSISLATFPLQDYKEQVYWFQPANNTPSSLVSFFKL